ncbi:hypothetical protein RV08_GL003119 [Enterococcus mundtii]|nr:hypothetical protein RV08_GL003119 [Enterococcus mundtii]
MKFPNKKSTFSYYGYMVASQSNFNACVGNKSPSECLLILGRGSYATAGITESSPYFTGCMSIIQSNNLTQYDDFAIQKWKDFGSNISGSVGGGWVWPFPEVGQGLLQVVNYLVKILVGNFEKMVFTTDWSLDR